MAKTADLDRTTDEVYETWRRSQDTALTAWRRWAESLPVTPWPAATPTAWSVPDQWPSPTDAVDAAFDVAEEVLATQRRFLHEWFDASRPAVDAAERQGREIARSTAQATRRTTDAAKRAATPDYASMTVEELQEQAAKAGIEGRSGMNKDDLVKALSKR